MRTPQKLIRAGTLVMKARTGTSTRPDDDLKLAQVLIDEAAHEVAARDIPPPEDTVSWGRTFAVVVVTVCAAVGAGTIMFWAAQGMLP